MQYLVPEDGPNSPRVGVVAIGGDAVGRDPGHRPRRTEERLGRCEAPRVAEAYVHEIAISINRAVEIAPLSLHFDVGLVDVPAVSHCTTALLAQGLGQEWGEHDLPTIWSPSDRRTGPSPSCARLRGPCAR